MGCTTSTHIVCPVMMSCASQGKMDADRRAALVQQGKALKAQLADLEAHLQQLDNRLQVRSSPAFAPVCWC